MLIFRYRLRVSININWNSNTRFYKYSLILTELILTELIYVSRNGYKRNLTDSVSFWNN